MHKTAKACLACVALTVALALGSMPMAAWGLDEEAQAFDSASAGPVIMPVLTDDSQDAEPAAAGGVCQCGRSGCGRGSCSQCGGCSN